MIPNANSLAKYIARKERVREQDDIMLRNENFLRANFRPMQLQTISQTMEVVTIGPDDTQACSKCNYVY